MPSVAGRFVAMRRLLAVLLIVSLPFLGVAASARSQPQTSVTVLSVGIKGWGSVKVAKGVAYGPKISCIEAKCPGESFYVYARQLVLVAKPYKGWKFAGWHDGCTNKKAKCVIKVSRFRVAASGQRNIEAQATFVPAAPGISAGHPLPIGTAANIGQELVVKVNAADSNVQLAPAAPAGSEYFDAYLTVTYIGSTGSAPPNWFGFSVEGSHKTPYTTVNNNSCPSPEPQPALDVSDPLFSGQSASGYVCWTIPANDANSLELFFGNGTLNFPGTTWFALH